MRQTIIKLRLNVFKFIFGEVMANDNAIDMIRESLLKNRWEDAKFIIEYNKMEVPNINFSIVDQEEGLNLLHFSIAHGNFDAVKYCVENGMSVNYRSTHMMFSPLAIATAYDRNDIVEYLLDKKAVCDSKDKEGNIPIYYSILNNNAVAISMLAEKSDIQHKNHEGVSPFMLMIEMSVMNKTIDNIVKKQVCSGKIHVADYEMAIKDLVKKKMEIKMEMMKKIMF